MVLHRLTGSRFEAARVAALACCFSVNAEMLKSPVRRAVVATVSVARREGKKMTWSG